MFRASDSRLLFAQSCLLDPATGMNVMNVMNVWKSATFMPQAFETKGLLNVMNVAAGIFNFVAHAACHDLLYEVAPK